ncbi:MAG: hypothetical protein M0001_05840 [Treponema sp.]|nr:hypothetical protein [Treponema sp.]
MNDGDIDAALRKLPPIGRARFWRLYAEDGRRFLDFWQDGGRGILGARHPKLGLGLKATIDRGLDRPLPSRLDARLAKAALALAPGMGALRMYRNEESALAALATFATSASSTTGAASSTPGEASSTPGEASSTPGATRGAAAAAVAIKAQVRGGALGGSGGLLNSPLVLDPARIASPTDGSPDPVAGLIRPFGAWLPEGAKSASALPIGIPLLPLPRGLGPTILLFEDEEEAGKAGPGDLLAPLALRAALDAITALRAYEEGLGEGHWRRIDRRAGRLFDRKGPWLFPKAGIGDWSRIFEAALERGLLLSPDPGLPSIVPGDFDDGEVARFADIVP